MYLYTTENDVDVRSMYQKIEYYSVRIKQDVEIKISEN